MEFSNTNALLIQAVFHSERGAEGVELADIIGYADYVNHSILTYQEFIESIESAKACGLIETRGRKLKTTETFRSWRSNSPKNLSFANENAELLNFLNQNFKKAKVLKGTPDFSEEEFRKAVEEYLKESR